MIIFESSVEVFDFFYVLYGLGVGIVFDDYGIGYVLFSLLKKYFLMWFKIDCQFVMNLYNNLDDEVIVKLIIVLGMVLGLEIIVEGIEEQCYCDILNQLGCFEGQGFWFSWLVLESEFLDGVLFC